MDALRMSRMIGLALDHQRGEPKPPELLVLESELEGEELARQKGKDPTAFLLKRLDLSGASFPIFIDMMPFGGQETAKCRLMWLPDGDRDYVEEYEPMPALAVFDPEKPFCDYSSKVTRRPARKLAQNFEISQREAYGNAEAVVQFVVELVFRNTKHRPRVKTERELFREMRG